MVGSSFSEDAEIRRIIREASVLGGAGYAILLQIAHPAVAQGVWDHSDFAARPVSRLRGTLTYIYGLVFGTAEEAERVSRIVRAMHAPVVGPGYDARDPRLQLWVAATLYVAGLRLYELTVGPLSPERKDEYYAQSAVLATALGCPREYWPGDRAAFDAYWERALAETRADATARAITDRLRRPANPLLRPAVWIQCFVAAGLLPPRLREGLGLAWGPRRQRCFEHAFTVIRAIYPRLPLSLRRLPTEVCLWDIRRRLAKNRLYRPARSRRAPRERR